MFVKRSYTQIRRFLPSEICRKGQPPRDRKPIRTGYTLPKLFLWRADWSHYNQLAVLSSGLIKDLMRKNFLPRFQAMIWDCERLLRRMKYNGTLQSSGFGCRLDRTIMPLCEKEGGVQFSDDFGNLSHLWALDLLLRACVSYPTYSAFFLPKR